MKEKYSELLKKLSLHNPLQSEDIDQMLSHIVKREISAGDYFDKAGNTSTEFCFVEKGLFRSFYRNANGDEFIKNFTHEGRILGSFTSLLTQKPSEISIQALETSVVLIMNYRTYCEFFQRHRGWESGARLVAEEAFMESERKEQQLLIYNAAERYDIFVKTHTHLLKRIHQYMIAMYLGISPVSLSRIINNNAKGSRS